MKTTHGHQPTPPTQGKCSILRSRVNAVWRSQRGALFGLDARLAMVVFAALAVIAGFFGLGRIETAKEARLIREVNNMAEAIQNFQTDIRTFYPFALEDSDSVNDLRALWDKTFLKQKYQPRWNGPYVLEETLNHKTFGRWWLTYGQNDLERNDCDLQSECYVWLHLSGIPKKTWEQANRYTDNLDIDQQEDPAFAIQQGKLRAVNEDDPRTLIYQAAKRRK